MAKSFTLETKSYDGRYLKLTCAQSQDISANQSEITWELESIGGNSNYYYTGPTTLTINGTQVYYRARTGAHEFPCAKGSVGGTVTVAHETDGTKSIAVSLKTAIYTKTLSTAAGTWTLEDIPRQASITAAPNFNDEQNPTITFTNPAGATVTSLALGIALDEGLTEMLPYQEISQKTGTAFTYILTDADRQALWNAMPDSNTLDVRFCLRTVVGGKEFLHQKRCTLTLKNPNPVLQPQVTEVDEAVQQAAPGAFVRYLSDVGFSVGAQGQKGADIVSQSVSCGGDRLDAGEGTLYDIKSGQLVFTATDSRGNTTRLPLALSFVDYIKPTCSIGSNRPDTQGNFTLAVSGRCYTGQFPSLGANRVQVYARYKEKGKSYGDWVNMTLTLGDGTYTATADFPNLDYQTTYFFQCKVEDLITTTATDEVPIKSMPVFDWGENDFQFNVPVQLPGSYLRSTNGTGGLNLNNSDVVGANAIYFHDSGQSMAEGIMFPRDDTSGKYDRLNVYNGTLTVRKNCDMVDNTLSGGTRCVVLDTGSVTDYVVENGTKDGWTYRKWQSGTAECWCRKEHTVAISQPWGSLYAGTDATGRTNYPFTFKEKPHETVTVKSGVTAVFAACSSDGLGDNTASKTASYNAICPIASTAQSAVYFEYYVVGRWK